VELRKPGDTNWRWRLSGRKSGESLFPNLQQAGVVGCRNSNGSSVTRRFARLVDMAVSQAFGAAPHNRLPPLLPVMPDLKSNRLINQQSRFTLHTTDEGVPDQLLSRFVVPKERKREFLLHLRTLGMTASSLFADLGHLSVEIKGAWGL
jgi:hypothetical protein